jgi:hypothetical protein
MTSRELAQRVYVTLYNYLHVDAMSADEVDDILGLIDESDAAIPIDRYVKVKESEARLEADEWWYANWPPVLSKEIQMLHETRLVMSKTSLVQARAELEKMK